jgi:hypothetical protein
MYFCIPLARAPSILSGSIRTYCKNTEALVVASKEVGLEITAEKTKYMIMSRDQHGGKISDHYCKGKAIPLQTLTGPESSRSLRLPYFKTIGT